MEGRREIDKVLSDGSVENPLNRKAKRENITCIIYSSLVPGLSCPHVGK